MLGRYDAPDSDSSSSGPTEDGEESSSSGSSSGSVQSTSKVANKMRNLTLNQVKCMEIGHDEDPSQAAANGKSRDRIAQALKKPCCKNRCKKNLGFKLVFAFAVSFWSLSKGGQGSLLLGPGSSLDFYT